MAKRIKRVARMEVTKIRHSPRLLRVVADNDCFDATGADLYQRQGETVRIDVDTEAGRLRFEAARLTLIAQQGERAEF